MAARIRFGVYELDPAAMELHKHGVVIRLQEQPLRVLNALLERPGEIVTREELQERIWGKDTFVDFEQSLNKAVNRLREALHDDAGQPRYIETVPRRGYRFVAPVLPAASEAAIAANSEASHPTAAAGSAVEESSRARRGRWGIAVLTLVLILFAGWAAYRFARHSPDPAPPFSIVPFTTYPGAEINPSFSPDGSQIAFAWTGGETVNPNSYDLYVKQVGVQNPRRLTTHPAIDVWPAWSPDGRYIAFGRTAIDSSGIYLVPAIGGPERLLSEATGGWFDELSWSPDGKWLAYASLANGTHSGMYGGRSYLLNPETLEKQAIPDPSPKCLTTWSPTFSPDGKSLALACMLEIATNVIYVQPAGGGTSRELARTSGEFCGMTWTADGKDLIYSADDRLFRVAVRGGPQQPLAYSQHSWAPTISRSGKQLAYDEFVPSGSAWLVDLSAPTKPGRAARKFAPSSRAEWAAHISPDGKWVAFNSDRSGTNQIWVSDIDGSNPIQLTHFTQGALGSPQWSPDNRRLAFDNNPDGPDMQTYIVGIAGGLPQRLGTGTDTASHPSWSRDGRWIYFDRDKYQGGLWKVATGGGKAVQLTNDAGVFPQESADGTRVFYVRSWSLAELWSAAATGGDAHPVQGMPVLLRGWNWVPARAGIYFIDGKTKTATLNLFDLASHQVQRIGDLSGGVDLWGAQLGVSGDGRTLMYSDYERNEADIIVVEGFH